ncbi:hotdog domain-containing protein [Aeromicrobium sp. PE09-221]|uniref:acyl-CoA thioesterase n=1 Tax=Aeromicrobium sp. PE09-221 TaxID=1898043 RepID=UPI000B3E5ED8|nr:hotdog domain-containing protein [Aeromicrobium sp. PE09-221]
MKEYRHEIPMRWADIDSLNHVNNVVYLEYAAQAEHALMADRVLERRQRGSVVVEFSRPIQLSRRPVEVVTQVRENSLVQCIGVQGSGRVFATVRSSFDIPGEVEPATSVAELPCMLRPSDLDCDGTVSAPRIFELLQETRIPYIATLMPSGPGGVVLATVSVDFLRPIRGDDEVESRLWVDRLGTSSYAIGAQLIVNRAVAVSSLAVLVGFDPATQRSRPLSEAERAGIAAGLRT